jgi:phosphoenolpyruvate synthase/pyruvate phosphate dikinase
MGEMILSFSALTPRQQSIAGGKGGTLARLYQAGFPVPDGFVLLPDAFVADELLSEAWAQVQAHLAQLRGDDDDTTFAVRSSALAEDSARASYAGEFETVLDMRTDDEVQAAIHRVRQSRHSERVRVYSQAQGIETDQEMAVVVQRLVRAEISGVLFTAGPVTGGRERMVGNFVHGLGEGLVSGKVEPHEFALSRPKGHYE